MYNIHFDPNMVAGIFVMIPVTCACVGCQEHIKLNFIRCMISADQPLYPNESKKTLSSNYQWL